MKKLIYLFIFILAVGFVACGGEKEPNDPNKFTIDLTAKVFIKPGVQTEKHSTKRQLIAPNPSHLTPLEIVRRGSTLHFYNDSLSSTDCVGGFAGKDTISDTPAFLRYSSDIINLDGFGKPYLVYEFICAYDIVIEEREKNGDKILDTIAYIPNANMRLAEKQIREALEAKDTAIVYDIFRDAFKFLPVTGKEYKELKRQNLQ